jgi:hypothetical protein
LHTSALAQSQIDNGAKYAKNVLGGNLGIT